MMKIKYSTVWSSIHQLTHIPYFRLCGTKLGCGEGGCGACTVMVSKMNRTSNKVQHLSVNACLAPVVSMHGEIKTELPGEN